MAYQLKTKATSESVTDFIAAIEPAEKKKDCEVLRAMMARASEMPAKMWGPSIVGFGSYDYKTASGHSGTFFLTGFAPRKQALTVYIMPGFNSYGALLEKLGKHKISKSCLYIKKLQDVNLTVLEELVASSVTKMRSLYPSE
ncbi:MAG: DUF1801 domain-containing protein [Pseudomonadota bacterium]